MEHYYQKVQGWFTFPSFYKSAVEQAKDGYHFVEVGVWKGTSAVYMGVEIVNSKKQIKFDCIDTFEGSDEHNDKNSSIYEPLLETKDGLYNHFLDNIAPLKDVITPIRKASIEASELYKDASLDLVFIDAAHDYDNVCADIKAWLPKVKPGGILAGHDIHHPPIQQALKDVLQNDYLFTNENIWVFKVKK